MGAEVPKQYLKLLGRSVLDHTLDRLVGHPRIAGVLVVLSPDDRWWPASAFCGHPRVIQVGGGAERCHSVRNALTVLAELAAVDDWVLVHDAARPCLRRGDLDRLMERLRGHPVGGLLGMPVRDTMKRANATDEVQETVSREGLWHAYTPQMFRLGPLRRALQQALDAGYLVTDDASAMELAGLPPLLVEGHPDNIKITRPADLGLAAFHLGQQETEDAHRSGL
jgi:2-C-methyl-D-erythritol 4-phosphate cytidylyltransferase